MRENVQVKGRRYLTEGRLRITAIDDDGIEATCLGDGAEVHALGYRQGAWWCNCPARTTCSHLVALQLVTVVTPRDEPIVPAMPFGFHGGSPPNLRRRARPPTPSSPRFSVLGFLCLFDRSEGFP